MMRLKTLLFLIFIPVLILSWAQGCSQVSFLDATQILTKSSQASSTAGNGGTYDGKLRVLHHYVDHFQCAGKAQPESILIRNGEDDWVIIRNSKEKCAEIDQAPATNVVYDDTTKLAKFENKTYQAPKPYIVDPNEDPNLPDIKPIDGVCEDINGKCSLLASLQSAEIASYTSAVQVLVPAGIYKLTQWLSLMAGPNSNEIVIQGENSTNTIIDGQNLTNHLRLSGETGTVLLENLNFKNGKFDFAKSGRSSSLENNLKGTLILSKSVFRDNTDGSTIYSSEHGDVEIRQSQFVNNLGTTDTIYFYQSAHILVDQSLFSGNNWSSISVNNANRGSADLSVVIRNSAFIKNNWMAIRLEGCTTCLIENTTVAENKETGLYIMTDLAHPDIRINNSTFANNGNPAHSSNGNFYFHLGYNSQAQVVFSNTISAVRDPAKSNCYFPPAPNSRIIVATNSLFDDSSCAVTGTGNITGDPQLGPLMNNGGLTPTLLPATGSPAIDAGDNRTCLATDQRGLPRPIDKLGGGPRCDMGAAELQ